MLFPDPSRTVVTGMDAKPRLNAPERMFAVLACPLALARRRTGLLESELTTYEDMANLAPHVSALSRRPASTFTSITAPAR